jgi:hypothetical protein
MVMIVVMHDRRTACRARAEQWLEKSAVLPRAVTPTAVKNSCVLR